MSTEPRRHIFHTRHDFTPEFAWAAFQLLAQCGPDGLSTAELQQMAQVTASPLARRADPHKLLASLHEIGLVERSGARHTLSPAGRAFERSGGRSETVFHAAVHCLYSWRWLWEGDADHAEPSWSYRTVGAAILDSGPTGVQQDALVLRVVEKAARFRAEKVSFSRSSVHGVAMWLEAQSPPLIFRKGSRLFAATPAAVSASTVQFHLAALCALHGGRAILNSPNIRLLAESWLVPPAEVIPTIQAAREIAAANLIPSAPPQLVAHDDSPALEWIAAARVALPAAMAEKS